MTIAALIASLTAPAERTTAGGLVLTTDTQDYELVGKSLWLVRRERHPSGYTQSWIVWFAIARYGNGWRWTDFAAEQEHLPATCPVRLLEMAPVKSKVWRDRVWAFAAEKFS